MFKNFQYLKILNMPILLTIQHPSSSIFFNKRICYYSSANIKESSICKLLDEAGTYFDISNKQWSTVPYPIIAIPNTIEKISRVKTNPSDTSVILFPGQGMVKVGKVKQYLKFPRVKKLFEIANESLGFDLLKICLEGPQCILDRTEFNQPATVVMSLAALEKLQDERPKVIESCVAVAGYSIGELTGLIFSGALTYEEGLKLVAVRGAAMQKASEISPQGMLFCYCLPSSNALQICKQAENWAMNVGTSHPVCRIAIYLYTQAKIFGGCNKALEYIQKYSQDLGISRVQRLPVSGGFHTILMEPAIKSFTHALNKVQIGKPKTIVYSNFNANKYSSNQKLNKKYLIKQIISPVKWEQIIQKLFNRSSHSDFPRTFDINSGGTMKTIMKKINVKAAQNCYIY